MDMGSNPALEATHFIYTWDLRLVTLGSFPKDFSPVSSIFNLMKCYIFNVIDYNFMKRVIGMLYKKLFLL